MTEHNALPVLYVILRTDMLSMTCGKAIAQGSHVTSMFTAHINKVVELVGNAREGEAVESRTAYIAYAYQNWCSSTDGNCGTVLTLETNGKGMWDVVNKAVAAGYVAGVFHDPTYPLRDGEVTHFIPVDTGGYIFVPDKNNDPVAAEILVGLPLHY